LKSLIHLPGGFRADDLDKQFFQRQTVGFQGVQVGSVANQIVAEAGQVGFTIQGNRKMVAIAPNIPPVLHQSGIRFLAEMAHPHRHG
jgi:hypothetical protein